MNGHRMRAWGLVAVVSLVLAGGGPACTLTQEECACPTYACVNEARLAGELALPEDTGGVSVKYCSEVDCVDGKLDLTQVGTEASCVGQDSPGFGSEVCFTRDAAGQVQVSAGLQRGEDGTLPPDGERYTLTIVDEASGDTLLEETREADYAVTREDCCHVCWSAEMAL
ncbi:MAG TPA: hypothetical protein VM686_09335 [Polyangiaceae bacterium]|nr:hypothetical protein [Polyangiaceae bacterium]